MESVYHFHNASLSPANVNLGWLEMAIARNRIVISLGEKTGNLWTAKLTEG